MSIARSFNIESPANILKDPSEIHCKLFNNILNESSTLSQNLIGNRFSHLAEKSIVQLKKEDKTEKSNLELMDDLGLLGALEDNKITSLKPQEIYQKNIQKQTWKRKLKKTAIADSGFLYALINKKDPHHESAKKSVNAFDRQWITTCFVFHEVFVLLNNRKPSFPHLIPNLFQMPKTGLLEIIDFEKNQLLELEKIVKNTPIESWILPMLPLFC